MKVHFGPYKRWFGPYQLAEALCFWTKSKNEFGLPEYPEWVHDFGEFLAYGEMAEKRERKPGEVFTLNRGKRKKTWLYRFLEWNYERKKRKMYVKIDRYDTWDVGTTLAHIAIPLLKEYKKVAHGFVMVDDEDVPEHLRSNMSYDDLVVKGDDKGVARWEWVLDEIIFALEAQTYDWDMDFFDPGGELKFKQLENGNAEVIGGGGRIDNEGRNKMHDRIKNGLRLYGKYYEGLWD